MNRDNQQVTPEQIAWLAGIWDGEGTFVVSPLKNGKYYSAAASVVNTSPEMIRRITQILDGLEITGHLYLEKMRTKKHKRCYHITIRNYKILKKFIILLLPYLVAKKKQAEILLKYIESRMGYKPIVLQDTLGRVMGMKSQGYSAQEIGYYKQLKKLNAFGISRGTSETIRWTPLEEEMI